MSVANLDSLCDPNIEPCATQEEVQDFEQYNTVNRSVGIILSVWIAAPPLFFFFAVYPWGNTDKLSVLNTKHQIYLISWYIFIGTHIILFSPQIVAWAITDKINPKQEHVDFYTFWLEKVIMNSAVAMFVVTIGMFVLTAVLERND